MVDCLFLYQFVALAMRDAFMIMPLLMLLAPKLLLFFLHFLLPAILFPGCIDSLACFLYERPSFTVVVAGKKKKVLQYFVLKFEIATTIYSNY